MFTSSQIIQDWLTECANVISKDRKCNVQWVTPVSSIKNRNGFPPNFIHSLDSSHMMLTSLFLWPRGITFASVRDCYRTHAEDVEIMNE